MADVQIQPKSNFTRNIIIALIVAMLIWQYGIPLVDESIKIPSEYLDEILYGEEIKSKWQIYVIDQISGAETIYTLSGIQLGAIYQMEEFKTYEIGLIHNQVGHALGTYKFTFTVETASNNASGEIYPFSIQIPAYQFWYAQRIPIPSDVYIANYERSDTINFNFIGPDGTYLKYKDVESTGFGLVMERVI